jgi:hypothetical protein
MEILIKIPTESFKNIEIPGGEALGKMYVAIVNIKDLPEELDNWREVNPREVNLNSGVSRQIMKTLEERPEEFVMRNRGITIVANHAEFDNRAKVIRLEFGDKERNGVLDGGHTLMNIREYLRNEEDSRNAYVRLEILEGIGDIDETVRIVDARNRSTEVKIAAFENLLGHFDSLKAVLSKEAYADKIAYKENELAEDGTKKEVPIEEVLSYILCFDVEDFDHNSHPIKAYSGKASVVKHYRDNVEQMQKYFPLAPDILKLRDTLYEDLPLIWNAVGNDAEGGRTGKIRGVKILKEAKVLPFSGHSTRHVLPSGFIYPALAAFRPLVKVENGKASWKDAPLKVYAGLREELVSKVIDTAKRTGNPNEMGKNPDFWGVCYAMVDREVLVRKL